MKVAVFDSGIGGITVLKELRTRFPYFQFIYYGDTANVPYGTKSAAQIKTLVKAATLEVKKMNVDAMVIACNTAACIAYEECQLIMGNTPVYSVVEAGIETIKNQLDRNPLQTTLILGTKATIRSKTYSTAIQQLFGSSQLVIEQACPLLVPMIEEGWVDHPILQSTVDEYCKPYQELTPGIAFLACTHYPWIKAAFEKSLPKWKIMDSASVVGDMIKHHDTNQTLTTHPVEWHFTDQDTNSSRFQLNEQFQ